MACADAMEDSSPIGAAGASGAPAGGGGASGGSAGSAGLQGSAGTGGASAAAGAGGGDASTCTGSGTNTGALHGDFSVRMKPAISETSTPATTSIIGKLWDGPNPTPVAFMPTMEAEGCTLMVPRVLFCSSCASGSLCVDDEVCQPYATPQTVCRVHVRGIGEEELVMDPIANNYQPKAGSVVPHPPCAEGDTVSLAADGGEYPPFELSTKCIPPLVFEGTYQIVTGEPLQLTWTAPAQPELSHILVKLDISHHGGTKGKIECDVPDTGSLAIPAVMIDALVELGVAGFPTIELTRANVNAAGDSPQTENVTLSLLSPVERAVEIEGLTSCASNDAQCPEGQTCQADLTCK